MTQQDATAAGPGWTTLTPAGSVADWRVVLLVDEAVQAGLLDALPGTAADLAARLDLDGTAVRVVLDALETAGIVGIDVDGEAYTARDLLDEAATAAVQQHARTIRAWSAGLHDRLRGNAVEPSTVDPETFVATLASSVRRLAPTTVGRCLERFPTARHVLDLGGCHGEYAAEFARRGLDVTLQDVPAYIDVVRRAGHVEAAGVTLFAGDFFHALPDGPFDLIFCAGVTHTLDEGQNRALYPRLASLLAPGGGLVVITLLRRHNAVSPMFAVQMLLGGHGGDTHAEGEYRDWLQEAGFGTVELHDIDDRAQGMLVALR